MVRKEAQSAGVPLDVHNIGNFFGWEAERVVAVIYEETLMMEQITRARLQLAVIIFDLGVHGGYEDVKSYFEDAEKQGLVERVQLKN